MLIRVSYKLYKGGSRGTNLNLKLKYLKKRKVWGIFWSQSLLEIMEIDKQGPQKVGPLFENSGSASVHYSMILAVLIYMQQHTT